MTDAADIKQVKAEWKTEVCNFTLKTTNLDSETVQLHVKITQYSALSVNIKSMSHCSMGWDEKKC